MNTKSRLLLYIIVLAVLDAIIPIPFSALILLYVLIEKPTWFKNWVDEIYLTGK